MIARHIKDQEINNLVLEEELRQEKGIELIASENFTSLQVMAAMGRTLTNKYAEELPGKMAENTLTKADITTNKNMVPFDDKSPFLTSGIRLGTSAMTTRGMKETDIATMIGYTDEALSNHGDELKLGQIKKEINSWMSKFPLYK